MPVRSRDYSVYVNNVIASPTAPTEIDCRNVISRSYYGMYHGVSEILTDKSARIPSVGCYEPLIEYLVSDVATQNEPYKHEDLKRLKVFLKIYNEKRLTADYDCNYKVTPTHAQSAAIALNQILYECSKMLNQFRSSTQP